MAFSLQSFKTRQYHVTWSILGFFYHVCMAASTSNLPRSQKIIRGSQKPVLVASSPCIPNLNSKFKSFKNGHSYYEWLQGACKILRNGESASCLRLYLALNWPSQGKEEGLWILGSCASLPSKANKPSTNLNMALRCFRLTGI
jgi:hypothetical protein